MYPIYTNKEILGSGEIYDALITNGEEIMKINLDMKLNRDVETGKISSGSILLLKEYEKIQISTSSHIQWIHMLLNYEYEGSDIDYVNKVKRKFNFELRNPLIPCRFLYFPFYNDTSFLSERNGCNPYLFNHESHFFDFQGYFTYQETMTSCIQRRDTSSILFCRILHKSTIQSYADISKKNSIPLLYSLIVLDGENKQYKVVLWNSMVLKTYCILQEGMLLLLTKYSVRNYNHDIEIHINNRVHSSLNLYTIQPSHLLPTSLPFPPYEIPLVHSSSLLSSRPSGSIHFMGVCVYVSEEQRERIEGPTQYETNSYKWLAMIDSYSSFLVFLKWSCPSDSTLYDSISVNHFYLFTCLSIHVHQKDSFSQPSFYLYSTSYTHCREDSSPSLTEWYRQVYHPNSAILKHYPLLYFKGYLHYQFSSTFKDHEKSLHEPPLSLQSTRQLQQLLPSYVLTMTYTINIHLTLSSFLFLFPNAVPSRSYHSSLLTRSTLSHYQQYCHSLSPSTPLSPTTCSFSYFHDDASTIRSLSYLKSRYFEIQPTNQMKLSSILEIILDYMNRYDDVLGLLVDDSLPLAICIRSSTLSLYPHISLPSLLSLFHPQATTVQQLSLLLKESNQYIATLQIKRTSAQHYECFLSNLTKQ